MCPVHVTQSIATREIPHVAWLLNTVRRCFRATYKSLANGVCRENKNKHQKNREETTTNLTHTRIRDREASARAHHFPSLLCPFSSPYRATLRASRRKVASVECGRSIKATRPLSEQCVKSFFFFLPFTGE